MLTTNTKAQIWVEKAKSIPPTVVKPGAPTAHSCF